MAVIVVRGREAILRLGVLLERAAAFAGEPGRMQWLDCFFNHSRVSQWRRPCLVLSTAPGSSARVSELRPDEVLGAALFTEYYLLGLRSGLLVSPDEVGTRNVFAVDGRHSEMVCLAMERLLRDGALLIIASYESVHGEADEPEPAFEQSGILWSRRYRTHNKFLPLLETFDETLAQLGKSTRFNMRYYRRRLEKRMQCEYVPDARHAVFPEELQAINASSLNPILQDDFVTRWNQAANHPEGFLVGLRRDGVEWLSFIGGWRNGTTTTLHWQVNNAAYASDSMSHVMRSHFLESEIARGASRFVIDGGSHTSIVNSFTKVSIFDLMVRRKSLLDLRYRALRLLFAASQVLLKRKYLIVEIAMNQDLEWREARATKS